MRYQLINPINQKLSTIEQILVNRGIPLEQIPHYLNTTDNDISPPELLGEYKLKIAAAYLISAIYAEATVIIIVDSDVDGFTSSAILINYLFDLFPTFVKNHIKYYFHEGKGHGLKDHIEYLKEYKKSDNHFRLVITPDSGSNDAQECSELKRLGIDTIVLDHHLCDISNPDAIIINNQLSYYPNKSFSGAGVVWQFCRYLDEKLGIQNADNYLDLVALGLCADMMSMTSIETKHVLNKGFKNVKNPFFTYLSEKHSYSMNNKINHTSVAFYIAPYINAICRSGTVEEKKLTFDSMLKYKAFQILPSTKRGHFLGDTETLVEQVMRIVTNVKNRQTKAQDAGLELLEKKIESEHLLDHKVLLFLLEPGQVNKNVAGLVANKLMAKYQRPVCVLTRTYEDQGLPWGEFKDPKVIYQGSARGCDKAGIVDFKKICEQTGVTTFTIGHPSAFGLGIAEQNIKTFIEKTDESLKDMSNEAIYYVDYIYKNGNINLQDILSIANMQDLWGQNVSEPLLCIEGLKITENMVTVYQKKDNTLKITLDGINLIKFKATDEECQKLQNNPGYYEINIIGRASLNQWMGNITPQILIQDYEIIDSNRWVF